MRSSHLLKSFAVDGQLLGDIISTGTGRDVDVSRMQTTADREIRVRNDEKILPERSQTITYDQSEINFLGAVLLMPRNVSYLYEVISGGAEIEYGFVVSAAADGSSIYDEVIREKVGGEYRRCQNVRIQNVFGGVSSATLVANNDMQRRCSGPRSVSIEELRKDIFSNVVDGVLSVPSIKVAHEPK